MSKKRKESRFGAHNVGADVERRQNEAKSYGYLKIPKGVQVFKEKVSKGKKRTYIDIIPYIVTDENHPDGNPDNPHSALPGNPWYKKPIWVHRGIGADNESIICLKTVGQKCPACQQRKIQEQQGMDKEEMIAKASKRNLYLLFPLEDDDYDPEEFHVWDISNGNFQSQLDEEIEEDPDRGEFPDPEFGKTLEIRFSEESFAGNKFPQTSRINFLDREPYDESIIDEAPNLDDMIVILTPEEIQAKLLDVDPEDLEDEERTTSRRRRGAATGGRKPRSAAKEDDDDDDDQEEEQRERKPRRSASKKEEKTERRKPRRSAKEEDSEDDAEEEEKTIPPPRRRAAAGKKPGKKVKEDECPEGFEFGEDYDEYDECEKCELYDACGDAYKENYK